MNCELLMGLNIPIEITNNIVLLFRNQLFLPNMRNKLMWFYQEVEEVEATPDFNRPGPSRATSSRTPVAGSSASNMRNKRLFLTDGWTCPFNGVCIYMFRINISKQLPEEGFHKDL
jgi:dynein heavy chain